MDFALKSAFPPGVYLPHGSEDSGRNGVAIRAVELLQLGFSTGSYHVRFLKLRKLAPEQVPRS